MLCIVEESLIFYVHVITFWWFADRPPSVLFSMKGELEQLINRSQKKRLKMLRGKSYRIYKIYMRHLLKHVLVGGLNELFYSRWDDLIWIDICVFGDPSRIR